MMTETLLSASNVLLFGRVVEDLTIESRGDQHNPFSGARGGTSGSLQGQLNADNANFARIYGFSFEGTYFDLPSPALFLVHGAGVLATEKTSTTAKPNSARAPAQPSVSGVSAADFEFADDLKVWSYDQADFSIRMDMVSGTFEQILLDAYAAGMGVSGAKVSGAKVSGAKVSGAKVSGAKVSGAKVSGAKVSGAKLSGDASD